MFRNYLDIIVQRKDILFYSTVCICILFQTITLLETTSNGIGLTTDSIIYIDGSRQISSGNFKELSAHYPPFYSVLLSIASFLSQDIFYNVRVAHVLCLVVHFFLLSYILYKETEKDIIFTFLGISFFATSHSFLYIHSMAWSESFFTFFALIGLYSLYLYIKHNSPLLLLFVSAFFLSLALLTRYVGITLIIAGSLSILLLSASTLKKKIIHSFCFILVIFSTIAMWFIRNIAYGSSFGNRELVYHPIHISKLYDALYAFIDFFFYPVANWFVFPAVVACYFILSLFLLIKKRTKTYTFCHVLFLFQITYCIFLFFSLTFFDSHTPIDTRILFPVLETILLSVVLGGHLFYVKIRFKTFFIVVLLVLMFPIYINHYGQKILYKSQFSAKNFNYASTVWKSSDIIHYLANSKNTVEIFTNGPDVLKLYLGIKAQRLPKIIDPITRLENREYSSQIDLMVKQLINDNAIIVYFYNITWREYLPDTEKLKSYTSLSPVYTGRDGIILKYAKE